MATHWLVAPLVIESTPGTQAGTVSLALLGVSEVHGGMIPQRAAEVVPPLYHIEVVMGSSRLSGNSQGSLTTLLVTELRLG